MYFFFHLFSRRHWSMRNVLSTNQRPFPAAHHGPVLSRAVRPVLRVRRPIASHLFRQRLKAVLPIRLWQVSISFVIKIFKEFNNNVFCWPKTKDDKAVEQKVIRRRRRSVHRSKVSKGGVGRLILGSLPCSPNICSRNDTDVWLLWKRDVIKFWVFSVE